MSLWYAGDDLILIQDPLVLLLDATRLQCGWWLAEHGSGDKCGNARSCLKYFLPEILKNLKSFPSSSLTSSYFRVWLLTNVSASAAATAASPPPELLASLHSFTDSFQPGAVRRWISIIILIHYLQCRKSIHAIVIQPHTQDSPWFLWSSSSSSSSLGTATDTNLLPVAFYHRWCSCKLRDKIVRTSFVNRNASSIGSSDNRDVSSGSENHDLIGIALFGKQRYAPGELSIINIWKGGESGSVKRRPSGHPTTLLTLFKSLHMADKSFVYDPKSGVQCCL